ncbi:hypothetical protein SPAN111604_15055 [Sphingomonas antarctica]
MDSDLGAAVSDHAQVAALLSRSAAEDHGMTGFTGSAGLQWWHGGGALN